MAKITMKDRIDTARESLKNGASLAQLQSELRKDLETLSAVNKYTEKQIATYNSIITNLGEPVRVKSVNSNYLKGMVVGVILTVAGGSIAACGLSKGVSDKGAIISTSFMDKEENPEESNEANYVLPDYLNFNVNDTNTIISNMSAFLNDGLSKGLTTVSINNELVSGIDEDNLSKKVESYLSMYVMANLDNIDYKFLAQLNQEGNLTADAFYEKAISAMRETYYDAFSQKEGQALDVYKLFSDKNCADYIKRLDDLIIKYNSLYNTTNDSERKEIVKEAIAIKEELLTYSASKKTELNPFAIDYAFTRLDVLNMLSNGEVITDNEADIGLYNSVLKSCVTEEQIKEWGLEEITLKAYDNKGDSKYSLLTVIRQMEKANITAKMQMALDYANVNEIANVETSFNSIVSEISKRVDLNNFKANEYTYTDWLFMVRNSTQKKPEEYFKNEAPKTQKVEKKDIPVDKVPVKDREPEKVVSVTVKDEKGKDVETNENYLNAKAVAQTKASKDVADKYIEKGTSLTIKFKTVPEKPNVKTATYKEAYDYWYAKFWNESLKEFQVAELNAIDENLNNEPTFKPSKDPVVVDKSDNYQDPTPKDEVTFEEETGTIVIEEGIISDTQTQIPSNNQNGGTNNNTPDYNNGTNNNTPDYNNGTNNNQQQNDQQQEQGVDVNEGILLSFNGQIEALEQFKQELLGSIDIDVNKHVR